LRVDLKFLGNLWQIGKALVAVGEAFSSGNPSVTEAPVSTAREFKVSLTYSFSLSKNLKKLGFLNFNMLMVAFVSSLEIFKWKSQHSALTLVLQYPSPLGNPLHFCFQMETMDLLREENLRRF
jgi:hypothetical protein